MNDKLRALMIEAGYAAPEIAGRANKLAELIIKECGEVAGNDWDTAETAIYKHFGVE